MIKIWRSGDLEQIWDDSLKSETTDKIQMIPNLADKITKN